MFQGMGLAVSAVPSSVDSSTGRPGPKTFRAKGLGFRA